MWQRWNYNSQPMLEIHAESRNTTANVTPKFANPNSIEVKIKRRGGRVSILPAYDHPHPPPPLYIPGWRMMRSCSLCTTDLYSGPLRWPPVFFTLVPVTNKVDCFIPGGFCLGSLTTLELLHFTDSTPFLYIKKKTLLVMRIRWRNICMW